MPSEKRNEFLDAAESEDDQADGYDSTDELTKGGRSSKRRKVDESDAEEDEIVQPEQDGDDAAEQSHQDGSELDGVAEDEPDQGTGKKTGRPKTELPDVTRPLTKKNLVASEKAIKKSGVVYLSRIPPFMKPTKMRSLLEPYGTINRIFLAPEDPAAHARRVRAGGNKRRSYTEGWVEFTNKKQARTTCELLNAQIIGGKKSSYYHDDIWNLLYLKGFKWHNLTEQIATENAERTSRMRAEISKATKENKDFVKNVDRAKMLDGMQAKAKKRKAGETADRDEEPTRANARSFRQIPQAKKSQSLEEQPENITRVLSKIF